jgi:hypothetical protein
MYLLDARKLYLLINRLCKELQRLIGAIFRSYQLIRFYPRITRSHAILYLAGYYASSIIYHISCINRYHQPSSPIQTSKQVSSVSPSIPVIHSKCSLKSNCGFQHVSSGSSPPYKKPTPHLPSLLSSLPVHNQPQLHSCYQVITL